MDTIKRILEAFKIFVAVTIFIELCFGVIIGFVWANVKLFEWITK